MADVRSAGVIMLRGAQSVMAQTTGNAGLDALADAIAERVFARLEAAYGHAKTRLLDVPAAAEYLSRTPSAIPIRHMIAKGMLPAVRREGRVCLDPPRPGHLGGNGKYEQVSYADGDT
jgi:hypothetical protein